MTTATLGGRHTYVKPIAVKAVRPVGRHWHQDVLDRPESRAERLSAEVKTLTLYVLDPLYRAAATFVQQLVVMLLPLVLMATAAGVALHISSNQYLGVLDAAGFAGLISIGTSVVTFWVKQQNPYLDLLFRVIKTWLQAFLGTVVAANVTSVVHADWKDAAALAIPVAFLALLQGIATLSLPATFGAGLLPKAWYQGYTSNRALAAAA